MAENTFKLKQNGCCSLHNLHSLLSLSLSFSFFLSGVKVFLCLDKILIFAMIYAAETVEVIHYSLHFGVLTLQKSSVFYLHS